MEQLEKPQEEKKRPDLLAILCVLTFIGSGLGAFSTLMITLSYNEVVNIADEIGETYPEMLMMISGGRGFFFTSFFLYTLSLWGAIKMWRLQKIGFHFYTAAQLLLTIVPFTYIQDYQFSLISVLVTVLFIAAYASNLKFMR